MKQQVDNLIANTLLDEGEVYLPEVGTLILYRHSSKLLSKRELQRPYRELRLTKEQRGNSITAYISHIASVSAERASDIYAEWLAQSLRNGVLTINGLCTIEGGKITTDKTFEDMANPKGRGTVKVNPHTNYFIYIIAGLCMGFALGIAGYVLYTNGTLDNLLAKKSIAPASEAFEGVVEEPSQPVESVVKPVIEPVEPATEQVAEQVVEQSVEPTILPMQKGNSYAVWGVYNELKNAEDAVSWLATRIPEIEGVNIYDYDGRYMVALCEVASRSECGRKVSAWKALHKSCKSVWVYTRK
ncbi:MAG: hypothetical protein E7129_01420 [Rikenellaceae bacterium]|nr:hypothetical protein [Rikenellaceae bacterium]